MPLLKTWAIYCRNLNESSRTSFPLCFLLNSCNTFVKPYQMQPHHRADVQLAVTSTSITVCGETLVWRTLLLRNPFCSQIWGDKIVLCARPQVQHYQLFHRKPLNNCVILFAVHEFMIFKCNAHFVCSSLCRGPAASRISWSPSLLLLLCQRRSSAWRRM